MKTSLRILLLVTLFLSTFCFVLPSLAVPSAEVKGLRVVADGYQDESSMRPFNYFGGTTIALQLQLPEGGIIGLDRENSELTSFTDSAGKDLMKKPEGASFRSEGFSMTPSISEDGRAIIFEVSAPAVPTKGARTITASGMVALLVATEKVEEKAENVSLEKDTEFSVGPFALTVKKISEPGWKQGDWSYAVQLQTSGNIDSIDELQFFDAQGNKLESRRASTMSSTAFGKKNVVWEYYFKQPVNTATIVSKRWSDLRVVKKPFELTVGAGL